jgi:hypothetical protein
MAQVDFVNYFSILFWFFILFVIYYVINYSFLLPNIYATIYTRYSLYKESILVLKVKFSRYIKNYFFYINIKATYSIFLFFIKKWIYVI